MKLFSEKPENLKMFICKICRESFDTFKYLRKHMLDEHGQLNFQCHICKKEFIFDSHLAKHRMVHTGEKPFKCDICDERFGNSSNLSRHKRNHSNSRPYSCEFCSNAFQNRSQKYDHERKEHDRPKLKCTWDGCQSEFINYSGLRKHIKNKHDPAPYHCCQCNRKYRLKRDLDHHKRKHQIVKTRKLLAEK